MDLSKLSLGHRVALTVVIVLAILFALALYGYLTGGWEAQAESGPIVCVPDVETKEKIRTVMMQSMEDALKNHLVHLHEVWMRDETNQPRRTVTGAQQGVRAYIGGVAAAKRWNPGIC